jgi:hypothetical protein
MIREGPTTWTPCTPDLNPQDIWNIYCKAMRRAECRTQWVQVLLGLCPLNIQDVNYFQNFTLFIQNNLALNQYMAGINLKVSENSHCTPFVESHLKLRYIPFGCRGC